MSIPTPKTGWKWLVEQTATFDIGTAGFTAIVGLTSGYNYWLQDRHPIAIVVSIATVFVFLLAVSKNAITLRQARERESMHELEGCLWTLHTVLDPAAHKTPGRLRLAVHVPTEKETLRQITEYIGATPKAGRVGRDFPVNAGIIGKAYRENLELVARRANDDYELYVSELKTDWNYTDKQARILNPETKTWMAVPFFDPVRETVDAVLYVDSTDREFLTEERQQLVLDAGAGIAIFIGRRYTS